MLNINPTVERLPNKASCLNSSLKHWLETSDPVVLQKLKAPGPQHR